MVNILDLQMKSKDQSMKESGELKKSFYINQDGSTFNSSLNNNKETLKQTYLDLI